MSKAFKMTRDLFNSKLVKPRLPLSKASLALIALLLSGCFGSSSAPNEPTPTPPSPPPPPSPQPSDSIQFNHLGLSDLAVETLFATPDGVWVAGDQGIFFSDNPAATNPQQANWQHQLSDFYTLHLTGFHADEVYAIGVEAIDKPYALVRSTDRGQTWQRIEHNFGGGDANAYSNLEVLYADLDTGYLYAAGQQAIAVSYDQGQQWQLLSGEWGMIALSSTLNRHPMYNDLWLGGQNAIEESTLVRFSLNQQTFEFWNALLPAPSVNQHIVFDNGNPDRLLISAEGGILTSDNYGETWDVLLEDTQNFYLSLLQSPKHTDLWYTGRWQKGLEPHPLEFMYSTDGGHHWQTHTHPNDDQNYGVRSMQLIPIDSSQGDVIWAGLQSGAWNAGGVMRIEIQLVDLHTP